ncbi:MAG: ATP phosphoribosyltransferase [Dehalococcoidia bacterium]
MIKLALPTGDLRKPLAALLDGSGLHVEGYGEGSRSYRFSAGSNEEVSVRVFRERDIPVQIALGNYDLGICGLAWVEELLCRFPQEAVVRLRDIDIGEASVYVAAAASPRPAPGHFRIVSEYPNLAEALAGSLRLSAYRVVPLWGSAQAYPPEDADLALVTAPDDSIVRSWGLQPLAALLKGGACLVANRRSLAAKDVASVLGPLLSLGQRPEGHLDLPRTLSGLPSLGAPQAERDTVRLAVPDGHQQPGALAVLREAGLTFEGYDDSGAVARPRSDIAGLDVKVIRPQDMPQQVALGNFDLAISGRDWLLDHTTRFPSSPVRPVLDLGRARYTLVATASEDVPGDTIGEAISYWRSRGRSTLRVASEYANLADRYTQDRRLGRCQVIPIAGASEGFVPEDAEILIEGTETGTTLVANRLKVIDSIFESTSHLLGYEQPPEGRRRAVYDEVVGRLRQVAAPVPAGGA